MRVHTYILYYFDPPLHIARKYMCNYTNMYVLKHMYIHLHTYMRAIKCVNKL